jgi:isocitrate/isopropylmalate dehydrogenase
MAVDDAYGAKEWREGEGLLEEAFRTEKITRRTCRAVAEYAFRHAKLMGATVFGGPKFTVSPIYEGMFKEELDAAAERHTDVRYEPQLIDATFALLLLTTGEALVVPSLNRDGDILSDLVLQFFGTIAGAESLLLSFDEEFRTKVVMAEAPHGTAPRLFGKNLANPMAMILAAGSLLAHFPADPLARRAADAIQRSTFEVVAGGIRTVDIGGHTTTTDFTDTVIQQVQKNLAV